MDAEGSRRLSHHVSSLRQLINDVGVRREGVASKRGKKANWHFDLKRIVFDATALKAIAETFWEIFQASWPFQVVGLELAGSPLVAAIALEGQSRGKKPNALVIRRERLAYGAAPIVAGQLSPNSPAILVDDILNSGASLERATTILHRLGGRVSGAFVLIDFESKRGLQWRHARKLPVVSIFSLRHFGLRLSKRREPPPLKHSYEVVWRFHPGLLGHSHVAPKSGLALDTSALYFGTDDGTFHSLDQQSGRSLWAVKTGGSHTKGIWSTPVVADHSVVFGGYDGNCYRLRLSDGGEIWRTALCDWIGSSPCLDLEHRRIYIGLEYGRALGSGGMAALCLDSGQIQWSVNTPAYQHGTPAYSSRHDAVLFGGNDGTFYCLDATTGHERWRRQIDGPAKAAASIDADQQFVAVGTLAGAAYIWMRPDCRGKL